MSPGIHGSLTNEEFLEHAESGRVLVRADWCWLCDLAGRTDLYRAKCSECKGSGLDDCGWGSCLVCYGSGEAPVTDAASTTALLVAEAKIRIRRIGQCKHKRVYNRLAKEGWCPSCDDDEKREW